MASDFILKPRVNNSTQFNEIDRDVSLTTGATVEPADHLFLSIEERDGVGNTEHFACVHMNPREALALAIHLMDWAREHMEGLRLVGDFGVEEIDEFEIEDAFDPYFGDEPDYEPKRTAINQSGYPVDVQQKPEHRPLALNECQCGACRDWRMTH